MIELWLWWLVVGAMGIVAFPIAFAFFRFLPDRGYSLAKVLGLLLTAYGWWIGGMTGLFPNGRGAILLVLAVVAVISLALAGRYRHELRRFFIQRADYVILVELLFLGAFAVALFLRSYVPQVEHTEKPMDFAFLNGIVRSGEFPPVDPWLSGFSLSYYYFGHLMVAGLTLLTGIPTYVTFNLGLALITALTATAAFGLVFNATSLLGASTTRAALFGLAGVVLLLIIGNLEGVFELLAVHGIGSAAFYQRLDIQGLNGPQTSDAWYPTQFWWWWRATRPASDWDWREPPIFTLILGDLHAHLLALPFVLLALAAGLNFLHWEGRLGWRFWAANPGWLLLAAVLFGGLVFLNAWDFPVLILFAALMVAAKRYLEPDASLRSVLAAAGGFVAPLAVLAVLLYLPFYLNFHPVGEGIHPLEAAISKEKGWPPLESTVTFPHHFLYIWAPLLWLGVSVAVAGLRRWPHPLRLMPLALAPSVLPVGLWALMILARRGLGGFADELSARGYSLVTVALLVVGLTVAVLALLQNLANGRRDGSLAKAKLFALAAVVTALLSLLGQEFYWVQDPTGVRSNTVFRLSYQVSILLSMAGAIGLCQISREWRPLSLPRLGSLAWGLATVAILGAAMVYPVTATFARTNGFQGPRSLDGLLSLSTWQPDVREAIAWLSDNVDGTPVILEAIGDDYKAYGRVAASTGLPTVLGWPDHEYRWRGERQKAEGQARQADVQTIYTTDNAYLALSLLNKYRVRYVYVGELEAERYGEKGLAKFAAFPLAFSNDRVKIYRVPDEAALPLARGR